MGGPLLLGAWSLILLALATFPIVTLVVAARALKGARRAQYQTSLLAGLLGYAGLPLFWLAMRADAWAMIPFGASPPLYAYDYVGKGYWSLLDGAIPKTMPGCVSAVAALAHLLHFAFYVGVGASIYLIVSTVARKLTGHSSRSPAAPAEFQR
jgi:hypothetical protein